MGGFLKTILEFVKIVSVILYEELSTTHRFYLQYLDQKLRDVPVQTSEAAVGGASS